MKKQLSGAQKRKAKRERLEQDAERERQRAGLQDMWHELLQRLGPPPGDPLGNVEFVNNLAVGMAWIVAHDATIPLEERCKQVANLIDRVGYTQSRALTARRIREIKEGAGTPLSKADSEMVRVGSGETLRAPDGVRGAGATLRGKGEY